MAVFQGGIGADGPEALVRLRRFCDRRAQRALGFRHRLVLRLRRLEVLRLREWLDLGDLPRRVVHDDFRELVAFDRVDGELKLALLDLILPPDRLPLTPSWSA